MEEYLLILLLFLLIELVGNFYLNYFAPDKTIYNLGSPNQIKNKKLLEKIIYKPHRYIGYIPNPNYQYKNNRHNSLGFRGDDITKNKRTKESIKNEFKSVTSKSICNNCLHQSPWVIRSVRHVVDDVDD